MYLLRECQPFSLPLHIFEAVSAAMSPARMAPYLADADNDPSLAIRRYRWNLLLVEALTIPLSFSEVFVRNAIHATLEKNLGENWLSHSNTVLTAQSRKNIMETEMAITETNLNRGRPYIPTSGQMITGMTFGFWSFLCLPRYHNRLWRGQLGSGFPHAPKTADPKTLHQHMDRLRVARNRIAHHEPIGRDNPRQIYNDCLNLISWIAGEQVKLFVADLSGFEDVITAQPIERGL